MKSVKGFILAGVSTVVLVAASLGAGVPDKAAKSLYERLGGKKAIVAVVDEFVANCAGDNDKLDTPASPCQRSTQSYPFNPRIVPVLNTLIGLRFKLQDHVYWHLDGGWRLVGFYVGGGPEFRF